MRPAPGGRGACKQQHGRCAFGDDPAAIGAGPCERVPPQPILQGKAVEQRAHEAHPGCRAFEVAFLRKMSMVVEMDRAVGMAAAKGEQLDRAEQAFVKPVRDAQVAVDEIVRGRSVGEKAERHGAQESGPPPAARREGKEAGGEPKGHHQRDRPSPAGHLQEVAAECIQAR